MSTNQPYENLKQEINEPGIKTPRYEASETEFLEIEKRYYDLLNISPEAIGIHCEGEFVYMNPAGLEIFGATTFEEFKSRPMLEYLRPDFRKNAWNRIQGAYVEKKAARFIEQKYIRLDGQIIFCETANMPCTHEGKPAAMVVIRDITERKNAEECIIMQRDLSAALLATKSLDEAISICFEKALQISEMDSGLIYLVDDESGNYVCHEHTGFSNEYLAITLHLDAASECASRFHSKIPIYGKYEDVSPSMKDITKQEGIKSFALIPILHNNKVIGSYFLASHAFSDLLQSKRYSMETLVTQTGIAIGRIRAEITLKKSEDFNSSLMNGSATPIFVMNPDTSIKFMNPALEKLTGFSLAEMVGKKPPLPWWPEQSRSKINQDFECALVNGIYKSEQLFQKKNGDHFWVEISANPVMENGEFKYYIANWVDITERKKAVEELKNYRDHLEEIVKERTQRIHTLEKQRREIERLAYSGQVAARVAHEINNPLAGIKNSFLLIKDAVSPNHPYHHYMELIGKEISRLACIVKQMFGLYKPGLVTKKEFKLNDLINDIIELIESTRRERDATIIVSANSISIDSIPESLLRQILYNIIINALEASDSGGEIIIQAKIEGTGIIISITDHGHGIPDEIKPHIFDPFYSTKKGDQKGLGLGLSISKKIMDELGGTISFETTPGSQTVFTINLPIVEKVHHNEIYMDS